MSGDPIEKIRERCLKRGASGIKGLSRTFRIYDDDGNKRLNKDEFKTGLQDYGVQLSDSDIDMIFHDFDRDGDGTLQFDEFLVKLRPPMSKGRLDLINQVFDNLADLSAHKTEQKKGSDDTIDFDDLKNVYSVKEHPKFKSGEWTKKQVIEQFINQFEPDPKSRDGIITREEFLNYYCGVSSSIDKDVYFDFMMRQTWPSVFNPNAASPRKAYSGLA